MKNETKFHLYSALMYQSRGQMFFIYKLFNYIYRKANVTLERQHSTLKNLDLEPEDSILVLALPPVRDSDLK